MEKFYEKKEYEEYESKIGNGIHSIMYDFESGYMEHFWTTV